MLVKCQTLTFVIDSTCTDYSEDDDSQQGRYTTTRERILQRLVTACMEVPYCAVDCLFLLLKYLQPRTLLFGKRIILPTTRSGMEKTCWKTTSHAQLYTNAVQHSPQTYKPTSTPTPSREADDAKLMQPLLQGIVYALLSLDAFWLAATQKDSNIASEFDTTSQIDYSLDLSTTSHHHEICKEQFTCTTATDTSAVNGEHYDSCSPCVVSGGMFDKKYIAEPQPMPRGQEFLDAWKMAIDMCFRSANPLLTIQQSIFQLEQIMTCRVIDGESTIWPYAHLLAQLYQFLVGGSLSFTGASDNPDFSAICLLLRLPFTTELVHNITFSQSQRLAVLWCKIYSHVTGTCVPATLESNAVYQQLIQKIKPALLSDEIPYQYSSYEMMGACVTTVLERITFPDGSTSNDDIKDFILIIDHWLHVYLHVSCQQDAIVPLSPNADIFLAQLGSFFRRTRNGQVCPKAVFCIIIIIYIAITFVVIICYSCYQYYSTLKACLNKFLVISLLISL